VAGSASFTLRFTITKTTRQQKFMHTESAPMSFH
jgi:hypothetical protein